MSSILLCPTLYCIQLYTVSYTLMCPACWGRIMQRLCTVVTPFLTSLFLFISPLLFYTPYFPRIFVLYTISLFSYPLCDCWLTVLSELILCQFTFSPALWCYCSILEDCCTLKLFLLSWKDLEAERYTALLVGSWLVQFVFTCVLTRRNGFALRWIPNLLHLDLDWCIRYPRRFFHVLQYAH